MPPRRIGVYALAMMEREGAVHGYLLSERIAERTAGAWRPGPGAVYPSLRALVDRGLARCRGVGRRQEYRITPAGRALLRRIRRRARANGRGGPDLSVLWAEVVGVEDVGRFLVHRLERTLDSIGAYVAQDPRDRSRRATVRAVETVLRERRPRFPPRSAGGRSSRPGRRAR